MRRIVLFLVSLLGFSTVALAQLNLAFPYERTVFQRDLANQGVITIDGILSGAADRIEARLVPVSPEQGIQTDWQLVDTSFPGNSFSGQIKGSGGWYSLEVRAMSGSSVVSSARLSRVGIGEVFVISGQSNAQGYIENQPNGATDDRVNSYNRNQTLISDKDVEWGNFSQLARGNSIYPRANNPWCWGELGDAIVRSQNVPVLFFNTAYEGTSIENWYATMNGLLTKHPYADFTLPDLLPYVNLRIVLQNQVSRLGVRAILWHHGETDQIIKSPEFLYYSKLRSLIEKTRTQTGKNIAWSVARVSYNREINPNLIAAQNRAISELPNTFYGPNTDGIQPRPDGVHFTNVPPYNSVTDLARAWAASLDNNFFANAQPVMPAKSPQLRAVCNASNQVRLSVDSAYRTAKWSTGEQTNELQIIGGVVNSLVRDAQGNYFYTAPVNASAYYPTTVPTIDAPEGTYICPGLSVPLTAVPTNKNNSVVWTTGESSATIQARQSGDYKAFEKNMYGCLSNGSNIIQARLGTKPATPVVRVANDKRLACEGDNVTLRIDNDTYATRQWSNGVTSNALVIDKVSEASYFVRGRDEYGCWSDTSAKVAVKIAARPAQPAIEKVGPLSVKAVNLANTSLNWYRNNVLLDETSNLLGTRQTGTYTVRAKNAVTFQGQQATCLSLASADYVFDFDKLGKTVYIYPNPATDKRLTVDVVDNSSPVTVTLIDLTGRQIWEGTYTIKNEPAALNLQTLPRGTYLVRVVQGSSKHVERILLDY